MQDSLPPPTPTPATQPKGLPSLKDNPPLRVIPIPSLFPLPPCTRTQHSFLSNVWGLWNLLRGTNCVLAGSCGHLSTSLLWRVEALESDHTEESQGEDAIWKSWPNWVSKGEYEFGRCRRQKGEIKKKKKSERHKKIQRVWAMARSREVEVWGREGKVSRYLWIGHPQVLEQEEKRL